MSQDECFNGLCRPIGRFEQLLVAYQNTHRPEAGSAANPVHSSIGTPTTASEASQGNLRLNRGWATITLDMMDQIDEASNLESPEPPPTSLSNMLTGPPHLDTNGPVPLLSDFERSMYTTVFEPFHPSSGLRDVRMTVPQQKKPSVIKMKESCTRSTVMANYVRMNTEPGKGIFEYEATFDPPIDSAAMRYKLLNQLQEAIGTFKTGDGLTIFLPIQFEKKVTLFTSTQPETNEKIVVQLIFREKKCLSDCVKFYYVFLRLIAHTLAPVHLKMNYFNPSSPLVPPAQKLKVWPGLVKSVSEIEGGIILCCDVSLRVLSTTTVWNELVAMRANPILFEKIARDTLVGLFVHTRYNNKIYRIDAILFDMTPMSTFNHEGNRITFVDYYKKFFNIEIIDKEQPLLLHRSELKMMGGETVCFCLIPELSILIGPYGESSLQFNFNRTPVEPMERQQLLQNHVNLVKNNDEASRILAEWGLSLNSDYFWIEGREMEPEQIIRNKTKFHPNVQFNSATNPMNDVLVPNSTQTWILVYAGQDFFKSQDFCKSMTEVCTSMGIRLGAPKQICLPNDRTETYVNRIREEINLQIKFVVCVFPEMRTDRYRAVKMLCEAKFAIPFQCITSRTISQPQKLLSVVQKIASQINCQICHEPWSGNIPTKTMMVCGVDVYVYPGRRGSSVVGYAASTNATMTRWYSRAKFQEQGVNMVDTIKICLIESLKKYYETNHDYPKQIVMFRDGVDAGQLSFCAEHEVPQLLSVFQSLVPPFEPTFTMVVVQKGINARFSRVTPNGPANPSPGTVVDQTITSANIWDFFLVSQRRNQGTVTPTNFVVVHDGGMKPVNLQKLTYKMTILSKNWTDPIRVPVPCQYAYKFACLVGGNIRG